MKSVARRGRSRMPGEIVGFARSGTGIRHGMPTAARQEAEWKALVYESAPLPCLNFNAEGIILDFNQMAGRMLGINAATDVGIRALADFIDPAQRRQVLGHIRKSAGAKETVVTRVRLRHHDGEGSGEFELSTRPAAEAVCYRTRLLPVDGSQRLDWPGGDARFRALVENSREVVCVGAPDGTIFYTTPSVRQVLGYEPAAWFGRNAFEIMHPDDAKRNRAALHALARQPTGTVIKLTARVRHADGSSRLLDAVLTNMIAQPDIGGIVCNYRDVTESRLAEEARRASEQRYRLLSETVPQMICVRDAEGRVLFCNSHWCEYRGISCDQATLVDWTIGIPPEDLRALKPPPWAPGGKAPWEAECRFRRSSDGAFRWHLVRIVALPEDPDARDRWIAIATDIHERKEAEQERERQLRQSDKERFDLSAQSAVTRVLAGSSSLAMAAPQLIDTLCLRLSATAGAVWSVTGCESTTALEPLLVRMLQEKRPLKMEQLGPSRKGRGLPGKVWATRKPVFHQRLQTGSGPAHHRALAARGLRGAFGFPIVLAGEVKGVIEMFTHDDVHLGDKLVDLIQGIGIQVGLFLQRTGALEELRRSQAALIQANNALEQRVRERTMEFMDANRELSAEIVERTRLEKELIRISEREQRRIGQDLHDGLCQELAAIAFMTGAVATRMTRNDTPEAERVKAVSLLLNESISRCRDIARGLHPVEMEDDGLMVALAALIRGTSPTIVARFRCPQPILVPESDTALNIYRIAQEAVNNAVRHSGASRITVTLERRGETLRLSVADNGRGIPQVKPGRRTQPHGGLGLHIIRYRTRTMGATLHIRSRRPRGTEIVCILPWQQ